MRNLFHLSLWICVVMAVCLLSPPSTLTAADRDPFRIDCHESGSSIYYLSETGAALCLTDNMPGWHLAPQLVQDGTGASWVVWEINRDGQAGIGVYDLVLGRAEAYMFPGLRDIGQIETVFEGPVLSDLFFIAKDKNIDVYHYRPDSVRLVNITRNADIEHGFSLNDLGGTLRLEVEQLRAWRDIGYDRLNQRVTERGKLRWRKQKPALQKKTTARMNAAVTLDDYFLAFGDSITWGKMYLPELFPGENGPHPELAYPFLLNELLENEGYTVQYHVEGWGGKGTRFGRETIDEFIDDAPYSTLIVMFGTNDVYDVHNVSIDQSLENMSYIVEQALAGGLRVFVCTIPPRNDKYNTEITRERAAEFNAGLRTLAAENQSELVEVYTAFVSHNPPDGWKDLLEIPEYIIDFVDSGCHPNPDGHALIASLMKDKYDLFLLKPPQAVASSPINGLNGLKVVWQAPNTHNIDHYVFEFGTQADDFRNVIELEGLEVQFILLQRYFSASPISDLFRIVQTAGRAPQVLFQRGATVYYRIKTVNTKGLESRYSSVGSIVLN